MKKASIAAPIIWAFFTILWIVNLCLRIQLEHTETSLILSGLCVILGAVNTVVHWGRYKKCKEAADDSSGEC